MRAEKHFGLFSPQINLLCEINLGLQNTLCFDRAAWVNWI